MIAPITNHLDRDSDDKAVPHSEEKTRDLHVKGVPEQIWKRARCNATNSSMSFKDYMIALLAMSKPIGNE